MKKFRFLGIIAVAAIIGFSATSCGGNGGVGGGALGMALAFTNVQVQEVIDWDDENDVPILSLFTGNRSVNAGYWNEDTGAWVPVGGTGEIAGGRFTFNIAEPLPNSLAPAEGHGWFLNWYYTFDPFIIAPPDARFAALTFRTPSPHYEGLGRARRTETIYEGLLYIWADRNVTFTGTGGTEIDVEDGVTYTFISANLNLTLQEGWNAVHVRSAIVSQSANARTVRITISHSHPNLLWVLFPEYDYDYYNND